jgi:hypothetical protein
MKSVKINKVKCPSNILQLSILTLSELHSIRGGFSDDKTTNKEKDIYDTREG